MPKGEKILNNVSKTYRNFIIAIAVLGLHVGIPSVATAELYQYGGEEIDVEDLSPALQQAHYDIESERVERLQALVDQSILTQHVDALAKKAGKSTAEVEAELLSVAKPTEKETQNWFESNKERLPPGYGFDQIKGDIENLLKAEHQNKARETLVEKLKKKGSLKLAFAAPEPPIFNIKTDGAPVKGSADAGVKVVEFADYQCPHCKEASATLEALVEKYKGKVKLVFMDYPINRSGISTEVAKGAFCAKEQGKFWEYHDAAFAAQQKLTKESPQQLAEQLKLKMKPFEKCLASGAAEKHIASTKAEGDRLGYFWNSSNLYQWTGNQRSQRR